MTIKKRFIEKTKKIQLILDIEFENKEDLDHVVNTLTSNLWGIMNRTPITEGLDITTWDHAIKKVT
jgi:hypothetical protein